jgi:NitT/TauT family transport system substrate-binding protein
MKLRRRGVTLAVVAALALAACGGGRDDAAPTASSTGTAGAEATPTTASTEPVTLRLGMFPNVTHATGLSGVEQGIFTEHLGSNVTLETQAFNAGPLAVEALFAGAIDATYIGPNPAINAFAKSDGEAIRIISGATSGGAFFVVKPGIKSAQDLKGRKIATPQLGNTQDVALRAWLKEEGLSADTTGGGDVSIVPQENAQTLETFKAGTIDGAWVPEPWATRLIQEGGAEVLVDERDLWPEGRYVTTHLIVATSFLEDHPDVVRQLLEGQVVANGWVNENPTEAQAAVNSQIEKLTGKRMNDAVLAAAWENLTFTDDPVAASLRASAENATAVGLLDEVDLEGIYDLTLLNEVLADAGEPQVQL